jgi:hypothetical protein
MDPNSESGRRRVIIMEPRGGASAFQSRSGQGPSNTTRFGTVSGPEPKLEGTGRDHGGQVRLKQCIIL